MLKIYFDWNIITHSKDKYPHILNIAEECGDRFIFPFSNAHIRDLLVSHKEGNKYYDLDLKLLEEICGKHFLLFEDGQMMPKFAAPREVINACGDTLEAIQNFEFISPKMYSSIKDEVKKLLPTNIYKKIQGADPKDVISIIDMYIAKELQSHNLVSLLSLKAPYLRQIINAEARFKAICLALDIFGFRPEKEGKKLMNIDTDASHIFYAGHCDVFVTADSKLRGKAEAMYRKYNYQTRILHPKDFELFIDDELQKEYSLKYISEIIDKYGNPRMSDEGAHYKLLPNHIFGMFNLCHKIDMFLENKCVTKAGLFRYSFINTPYLFYTEIFNFCNFIEKLLPPSEREVFHEGYVKPLFAENFKKAPNAKYIFNCEDLDMKFEIYSDPESPAFAPMMLLEYGNRFEELFDKLSIKESKV